MNFDRATKIIHFNDKYATELLKPLFFPRFVSIIIEQILYAEFLVSIIHTYDAVGKMEPG
jgi:SPX domain protein involved in polyphosphate accumulation